MGMGRGRPLPKFFDTSAFKKWYKLSTLGGGGAKVIWTKSKRTATFFRETVPQSIVVITKGECTSKELQRIDILSIINTIIKYQQNILLLKCQPSLKDIYHNWTRLTSYKYTKYVEPVI